MKPSQSVHHTDVEGSPPSWGVWIETKLEKGGINAVMSPPSWGVWIETG